MADTPLARAVAGVVDAAADCVESLGGHLKAVAGRLDKPAEYQADQAAADMAGLSLRALGCGASSMISALNVVQELSEPPIREVELTIDVGSGPRPAQVSLVSMTGLLNGPVVGTVSVHPDVLLSNEQEVAIRVAPSPAADQFTIVLLVHPVGVDPITITEEVIHF